MAGATLTQVLAQIRLRESHNNYGLRPQDNYNYGRKDRLHSEANGAYQFQPATWRAYARDMEKAHPELAGTATRYAWAYQAPPAVQDAVAAYAALHGPGINSTGLWGASAPPGGYPRVATVDTSPVALATQAVDPTAAPVGAASTGVPISPGYVVPQETAASYFAAQRTAPLPSGTLTSQDINADPNSRMSYAEQRDEFAQRYASIPWSALHPQEQAALASHFGADAPSKYEAMRQSLTPMARADVPSGETMSPYVRGDFFGSPPVTPPASVHSTPQMSYAPASYAAIQPYSTQPPSPAMGAAAASYVPPSAAPASLSGYQPVAPSALPIAPSDASANEFSTGDIMNAQAPGQMPAAAPAAAPAATGGVAGFVHQLVQAVAPIAHQVVQTIQTGVMPGGQSLGGFLSGISSFGGGPLPSGVGDQSSFSNFLNTQHWEGPGTSHAGTAFSPGSGGATYQYFTPSQPGGIGGYVVPAGHPNAGTVYTYDTSPGVQANP